MGNNVLPDQAKIITELVESIAQAIGACSQLIHHLQDPRFIIMRDVLSRTKSAISENASADMMYGMTVRKK